MVDKPRPSMNDPSAWVPYRYEPSKSAAIAFVVLFSLSTILHCYQLINKRTWYFIPLIVGGIFEISGYVGRIISANNVWAIGPFIMQSLLLLVAPALFAASIYIILGRIILLVHGERYSLIRRTWLTKVFVAGDVLSFMVQGAGGGIQAGGTVSSLQLGEKIILSGLFLQLAFFGFFIVVVALFHRRLVRANTPPTPSHAFSMSNQHMASTSTTINIYDLPWKRHLYALYAASTLIVIRSIFRVIEYLQGNTGYLLRYEVFLYVFDAALMLGVMVLFNWVHPSQVTDVYQRRKREQVVWT